MLSNAKYIGRWAWGTTKTRRRSDGRTRQVPVALEDVVVRDRPELRIIDQATWESAQRRLAELARVHGGGARARRAARPHSSVDYPKRLLSGLIACRQCGAALHIQSRPQGVDYMGCPSHAKGLCAMATRVIYPRAEEALLGMVGGLLSDWPGWPAEAAAEVRQRVAQEAERLPAALEEDRLRLAKLEREIANLVEALADGSTAIHAVERALAGKESETTSLRARIAAAEARRGAALAVPDDAWIRAHLGGLPDLLRGEPHAAAPLLRRLLGPVRAEAVIAPGKVRGYARLRVQVRGNALVEEVLRGRLPGDVLEQVLPADGSLSGDLVLDLGSPTRYDRLATQIAAMREEGMTFPAIGEATGIGSGNAYNVWRRHTDALAASAPTAS